MSLRLKVMIAAIALSVSAFAVLGDKFFQGMGFPPNSGRIVVAGILILFGVVWFFWTSVSSRHQGADAARGRRKK